MNKTDVETLILRDLESNDIDQLWESIENDLKDLPSSWPVNKRFFTELKINGGRSSIDSPTGAFFIDGNV